MWTKTFIAGGLLTLSLMAGCDEGQAATAPAGESESSVIKGARAYAQTCATCHGANGQGMPNQGENLRISSFIAAHSDDQLVDFIKAGRLPADPSSVMKLAMPPNGGNAAFTDAQLHQIVAYLRQMQREAGVARTAGVSTP